MPESKRAFKRSEPNNPERLQRPEFSKSAGSKVKIVAPISMYFAKVFKGKFYRFIAPVTGVAHTFHIHSDSVPAGEFSIRYIGKGYSHSYDFRLKEGKTMKLIKISMTIGQTLEVFFWPDEGRTEGQDLFANGVSISFAFESNETNIAIAEEIIDSINNPDADVKDTKEEEEGKEGPLL